MRSRAPAYPHTEHNGDGSHYHDYHGLTKRELFAAMAMQGLAGDPKTYSPEMLFGVIGLPADTEYNAATHWPMFVARRSVSMADALLAALDKE